MAIEYPLRVLKKAVDISSGKKVLREVEIFHQLPVETGDIDAFCKYLYNHYGHGTFVVKDRLGKPVLHALVFSGSYKLLHGQLKEELKKLDEGHGISQGNERIGAAKHRASPDLELDEVKGPMFENRLVEEMHAILKEIKKDLTDQESLSLRFQKMENNLKDIEDKLTLSVTKVKKIDEEVASELSSIRHSFTDKLVEVRGALEAFPTEKFREISDKLDTEEQIMAKLQEMSESDQIKRLERRLALQEEWIERRISGEFDRVMAQLEENRKTLQKTVEKEAKSALKRVRKAESKAKKQVTKRAEKAVEKAERAVEKTKKIAEKESKLIEKEAAKLFKEAKKEATKATEGVKVKAVEKVAEAEKRTMKAARVIVREAKKAAKSKPVKEAVKVSKKATKKAAKTRSGKRIIRVVKAARRWSATEIDYLKQSFPTTQTKVLAAYLSKSTDSVLRKAKQLGLKRMKPAVRRAEKAAKRAGKAAKKTGKAARAGAEMLAKEVIAEVKKAGREAEATIKKEKRKAIKAVKKAKPKRVPRARTAKPKKAAPKAKARQKKPAKKK